MNFFIRILGLFILIAVFVSGFGQNGSVKGIVYDQENGEPCLFANVLLKGLGLGSSTDINGYFSITKIPHGNYTLIVTYIGYDTLNVAITIQADKIINKKLYIKKSVIILGESIVSAERQEMKTEVKTSIVKISPKQIKQIPMIGSEPDLAQYLQILPGVIFTGDQGGQLYIRGGPPIQNKVLLDGMIVYNPFHSIGLFSVFDSDILRNADIYTGGFNAEYGGRISSIMDITTRDGNKKRLSGKFSSSTFGSKLMIEGPLKKQKNENDGSTTFIFSGKKSYLEQSSKIFYNYIDTAGLPFNFTDIYGKISMNAPNGSKVNFFGFNFSDQVTYKALTDLAWKAQGLGTQLVVIPGNSSVLIKANIAYSNYKIEMIQQDQYPRMSLINGFNLGLGFVYFIKDNEVNYGVETLGFKTDFNFYNSLGRRIWQIENTTEMGAYVKYKHKLKNWIIEPGFRLHYYASLSNFSPEPRLGFKYNISNSLRIKFAGGLYSQNLIAANSDRDVVNLFYGFLSGSENIPKEFDGEPVKTKLQKSRHAILGFEFDLTKKINLNVETYIKDNTQLTNLNRNKLYEDISENYDKPEYLKKDFIIETGKAYGIDFVTKYDYKRTYLWFVYSLGYVTRYDGISEYYPHFDRRHNINFVFSQTFGKDLNWEVSARWNFGSGFPFTKTQGFYEQLYLENGISSDFISENGDIGIIYGSINQGRLPVYHRLDLTVKRNFELSSSVSLETSISITNVYNRENIFYFDRLKYKRINQLPVMPSFGLSLNY